MSDNEESFEHVQIPFEARIMELLEQLQTDMQSMKTKVTLETQSVNDANEMQRSCSPAKNTPCAYRDPNERIDYSFIPSWEVEDDKDQRTGMKLFKMTEPKRIVPEAKLCQHCSKCPKTAIERQNRTTTDTVHSLPISR